MNTRSAACACGAVSLTVEGEPLTVSMCHCLACQRRTGSTYSVHAYFPKERVSLRGTPKRFARAGDTGAMVDFHFCPDCGSTTHWELEAISGRIGIPVGIFADPGFPPPSVAIFVPHRHPWVVIPEGVPQNEGHSAAFKAAAEAAVAKRGGGAA